MKKQASELKPGDRVKKCGRTLKVIAISRPIVSKYAKAQASVIVYWHPRAAFVASRYALTQQVEVA